MKLDRAHAHLDRLDQRVQRWLKKQLRTVRRQTDPQTGERVISANAETLPDEFGLLAGDCLHNLRSALDHMAFQLAAAYTQPLSGDIIESSEFPIFADPAKYKRSVRGVPARGSGLHKIRGVEPAIQGLIESVQPYNGSRWKPLAVLHDLDRIDKHRNLNLILTMPRELKIGGRNVGIRQITVNPSGPIEGHTELARYTIAPINPAKQMYPQEDVALQVVFAEGPVNRHWLVHQLREIENTVLTGVLPLLRQFL